MLRGSFLFLNFTFCFLNSASSQIRWKNVDSLYQPLPTSIHVYYTDDSLGNAPFRAYYLIADLKDKKLEFTVDTSKDRRLRPQAFYEQNGKALAVVNATFFSFETNRNLNVVIKDGKVVSYNVHSIPGRGKDTLTYRHTLSSAIGISKKREADVGWIFTDSSQEVAFLRPLPIQPIKDSVSSFNGKAAIKKISGIIDPLKGVKIRFDKWKVNTAIGGGPVLVQVGIVKISNNEELRFAGKAINDKHPRTAMGYTKDNRLIILVVEGRNPRAAGATLIQEAEILSDLGCWEALNLDGGGSSCLLVNGKETIKPSDTGGQRPVPAVFIIKRK